jgi:hypothetical protein
MTTWGEYFNSVGKTSNTRPSTGSKTKNKIVSAIAVSTGDSPVLRRRAWASRRRK